MQGLKCIVSQVAIGRGVLPKERVNSTEEDMGKDMEKEIPTQESRRNP